MDRKISKIIDESINKMIMEMGMPTNQKWVEIKQLLRTLSRKMDKLLPSYGDEFFYDYGEVIWESFEDLTNNIKKAEKASKNFENNPEAY